MSRILGLILWEFASDIWVLSMLPLQPSITEKIKERKSKHSNEKRKEKVAQFSGVVDIQLQRSSNPFCWAWYIENHHRNHSKNKRKQKTHPNIHLPSISQWRTVNPVGYNKPEKHNTLKLPITATLHKRIQNPRPTIHLRSFHNDELETRRVIKSL